MTQKDELLASKIDSFSRVVGEPVDELTFQVRSIMLNMMGRIDQGMRQRRPLTPVEARRIEWKAAKEIVALVRSSNERGAS